MDHAQQHHHHHHGHFHGLHDHARGSRSVRAIATAFSLNLVFAIVEVAGGIWTNSAAVLADALHDFGDAISLGFSLVFERVAQKKRDQRFSYGYRRFSLLAALTNGIVLLVGSIGILAIALPRIMGEPQPVHTGGMIVLAVFGILFNGLAALRLRSGGTLNEKVLTWHLLEDVLGWVAILVGATAMHFFHLPFLDPVLSLLFTALTLWNAVRLLKQTVMVFLQSIPGAISQEAIEGRLKSVPGVDAVHDTHIWSMDGEYHVLTTHIVIPDALTDTEAAAIKTKVRHAADDLHIRHVTIEMERASEACQLRDC